MDGLAVHLLERFGQDRLAHVSREDLAELGVPRERRAEVLDAIAELTAGPVRRAVREWPPMVALPLEDFLGSPSCRLRLWGACELTEMLLRLSLSLGVADLVAASATAALPERTLQSLYGRLEEPTAGAWRAMAVAVAEQVAELSDPTFPDLVGLTLCAERLFTGGIARSAQNETNALIAVRNALAHGGGVIEARAAALHALWQPHVDTMVAAAEWLSDLALLVRRADGRIGSIRGTAAAFSPVVAPDHLWAEEPHAVVAAFRGRHLPLHPLVVFDRPRLDMAGDHQGEPPTMQAYTRKSAVLLHYTPTPSDAVMQSLGRSHWGTQFDALFDFSRLRRRRAARDFLVPGFEEDVRRDAARTVGRAAESDLLWDLANRTRTGFIWVPGRAGIGKSWLMARLATQLLDEAADRVARAQSPQWLALPYRLRSGDTQRCRKDRFVEFLIERLEAWAGLQPEKEADTNRRRSQSALSQLEYLLARVHPNRLILVIDGLDEVDRFDPGFVDTLLPQLASRDVLVICSGRPEPRLTSALRERLGALAPFPAGLPPMSLVDVRNQIFARIERAGRRLLARDEERGDGVLVNPFVDEVAKKADGLPVYVDRVINDVLAGRITAFDAREGRMLPPSIDAYFAELVERNHLSDIRVVQALVAAALTHAEEPLPASVLAALLRRQGFSGAGADTAALDDVVNDALASLQSMILASATPDGEIGYRLYHLSLREHLRANPALRLTLGAMQRTFVAGALAPGDDAATRYLYRTGIFHLVAADDAAEGCRLLRDFDYLAARLDALSGTVAADGIEADWQAIEAVMAVTGEASVWREFWRRNLHILRRSESLLPARSILLTVGSAHAADSPVAQAAEAWASKTGEHWWRVPSRPKSVRPDPCLAVLEGHPEQIYGAVELPDGRLVSWGEGTIRVWTAFGTPAGTIVYRTDRTRGAQRHDVEHVLAAVRTMIGLPDWHLPPRQTAREADKETTDRIGVRGGTTSGAWQLSDGRVVSSDDDWTNARIWPLEAPPLILEGSAGRVQGVLELPDGGFVTWTGHHTMSVTARHSAIRLWNADGSPAGLLPGRPQNNVRGVVRLSDGRLLSWAEDKTLRLWDPNRAYKQDEGIEPQWCRGAVQLSDGRFVTWSWGTSLRLWSIDGHLEDSLEGHTSDVKGAIEVAGGRILSWSWDGTLRLWPDGEGEADVLSDHESGVVGALRLHDGRVLSWARDGGVRIWSPFQGSSVALDGHADSVYGARQLADGRLLTWSRDFSLRLFDEAGRFMRALDGHERSVRGATELHGGRLISASWDGTLRLWTAEGYPLARITGHAGKVEGVMQCRDGRILSWCSHGEMRLWTAEGEPLHCFTVSGIRPSWAERQVWGMAELSNGRLVSWHQDDSPHVWTSEGEYVHDFSWCDRRIERVVIARSANGTERLALCSEDALILVEESVQMGAGP